MEKFNYTKPGHENEINQLKAKMQASEIIPTDNEVDEINATLNEPRQAKIDTAENLKLPEPTEEELLSSYNHEGEKYIKLYGELAEDIFRTNLEIESLSDELDFIKRRKEALDKAAHDPNKQTHLLATKIRNVEKSETSLSQKKIQHEKLRDELNILARENNYDEHTVSKDIQSIDREIEKLQDKLAEIDERIITVYGEKAISESPSFLYKKDAEEYDNILDRRDEIVSQIKDEKMKIIMKENRN